MSTRKTYKDEEFFVLDPGKDAYAYFCNSCNRHYQWEKEFLACRQKHRLEERSQFLLRGDS